MVKTQGEVMRVNNLSNDYNTSFKSAILPPLEKLTTEEIRGLTKVKRQIDGFTSDVLMPLDIVEIKAVAADEKYQNSLPRTTHVCDFSWLGRIKAKRIDFMSELQERRVKTTRHIVASVSPNLLTFPDLPIGPARKLQPVIVTSGELDSVEQTESALAGFFLNFVQTAKEAFFKDPQVVAEKLRIVKLKQAISAAKERDEAILSFKQA